MAGYLYLDIHMNGGKIRRNQNNRTKQPPKRMSSITSKVEPALQFIFPDDGMNGGFTDNPETSLQATIPTKKLLQEKKTRIKQIMS